MFYPQVRKSYRKSSNRSFGCSAPGDGTPIHFIGLEKLKQNKRASGRHKDLDDLENLP